jgi:hypothetical protein
MLSHADRSRVEKLVAMLASSFNGERATAAGFLGKMVSDRNLTIGELLGLAQAPPVFEPPPPSSPHSSSRLWAEDVDLLDHLAAAVNFASVLSPWECEFSSDVSRKFTRASQLSERQRVVAERIVHQGKKGGARRHAVRLGRRWVPRLTRLGEKENGDGFQSQLEHWRRLSADREIRFARRTPVPGRS